MEMEVDLLTVGSPEVPSPEEPATFWSIGDRFRTMASALAQAVESAILEPLADSEVNPDSPSNCEEPSREDTPVLDQPISSGLASCT